MSQEESGAGPEDGGLQKRDEVGFSPFTRRAATVLAMVALFGIGLLFIWEMISLILVLFLAVLFAIFLRGLTLQISKRTPLSERWALVVVTLSLVAVIGGVGLLIAPAIAEQMARLGQIIPEALDEFEVWFEQTAIGSRVIAELVDMELSTFFSDEILGGIGGAIFGGVGFLSHAALIVAVGVYLAFDPDIYKRGVVRMVPMHYRERVEEVLLVSTHQLAWWLVGRLVAMLAVAVIVGIGLWILGIPLAFTLGMIAGLLSFVPILGAIVSFIPAALIALLAGPQFIIWAGLVFMGAQAVESYVVTPMVQQRFVSLPHAMTLIAEVFSGLLFGIIGITVATPLAVLLMVVINMMYVEDVLGDTTPYTDLIEESR